jgi:uncharacterized membrane protein (DUF4010 family)
MSWYESLLSMFGPFLIGLLVAAGTGLIVGLEREFNTHSQPSHIGGIRTFILGAIIGFVVATLAEKEHAGIAYILSAAFCLLVVLAYGIQAWKGQLGLTSEIALLLTFSMGAAIAWGWVRESLALVVLLTVVLSLKEQLHSFISRITEVELFAFIKFIVLALLILPNLPKDPFGPENLLNLYDMGWIVVLVLSISFIGYLLLKFGSPHKGILLTSVIGGLISSTLIAWVFSRRSKDRPDLAPVFGTGIVLASSVMFVRVTALVFLFAPAVGLRLLWPFSVLFLVSLVPLWQLLRKKHAEAPAELSPGNPLDIKNALFFVVLYIGVTLLMYGSRQWIGPTLTYLSGAAAGIADMDAITISTAKWAVIHTAEEKQAAAIILLAAASNSVFKCLVSIFNGARAIRPAILTGFGWVLLVAIVFLCAWFIQGL